MSTTSRSFGRAALCAAVLAAGIAAPRPSAVEAAAPSRAPAAHAASHHKHHRHHKRRHHGRVRKGSAAWTKALHLIGGGAQVCATCNYAEGWSPVYEYDYGGYAYYYAGYVHSYTNPGAVIDTWVEDWYWLQWSNGQWVVGQFITRTSPS
jgi:hypothetical protein